MPATETLALTRWERRREWVYEKVADACVVVMILGVITVAGSLSALTALEATVQYSPNYCFDSTRNCEVVSVTHVYNVSDLTCTDSFVYVWKFFESPVLFEQVESRRRAEDECLLDLDINEQNATFRVGNSSNTCFRVKDLFQGYASAFNCAPVLQLNNATAAACQTFFPPTSDYDASLMIALTVIMVLYVASQLMLDCAGEDYDADDDFDVAEEGMQIEYGEGGEGEDEEGEEEEGEEDEGSMDGEERRESEVVDIEDVEEDERKVAEEE